MKLLSRGEDRFPSLKSYIWYNREIYGAEEVPYLNGCLHLHLELSGSPHNQQHASQIHTEDLDVRNERSMDRTVDSVIGPFADRA